MRDLEDWIQSLRRSDKLILVEGIKDKKALEILDIKNITTIKQPLYQLVEEIASKTEECILLLDLDMEGKKLYSELRHQLQKRGVRVDTKFREFLFKNTKLTHIEGLTTYLNSHNQFS